MSKLKIALEARLRIRRIHHGQKGENMDQYISAHSHQAGRARSDGPAPLPLVEDLKILRQLEGTIEQLDQYEAGRPQRRQTMQALRARLGLALGHAIGQGRGHLLQMARR